MPTPRLTVLLDTNVVLDLVMAREPFVHAALEIFAMGEAGLVDLALSTDAISTIFYVVERNANAKTAREAITNLVGRVHLVALDAETVLRGLAYDFVDVEDALVASVAVSARANLIVTRNVKDFHDSPITVMTPAEFLAAYRSQNEPRS